MDKEQLLQNGFKEIKLISTKENKTIIFNDYMINREGKVWSFRTSKPKILDGAFNKGYKIYSLYTTDNGKYKQIIVGVYVLIASTFLEEVKINNIEDENTFEVVHHIDHNKNNNSPSNLLWISKVQHEQLHSKSDITRQKMSENHADISGEKNPMFGRTGENHPCYGRTGEKHPMFGRKGADNPKSKPVIAFTNSGSYCQEFAGMNDAARELEIKQSSISECCKGKRKSAGKYNGEPIRWKYKE